MYKPLLYSFRVFMIAAMVLAGLANASAQKMVTGRIIDATTGEPLIGANVLIKGTTNGTVTDFDGMYSIQANEGDVLVISYTGYSGIEQMISSANEYNMSLEQGQVLEDIVVIGYGTTRKADLTGSVVVVEEENFNKGVYTSPEQLIQGQAAGVQVINNSGQPGGLSTVRIRGNSSIRTGNQPLYVVDGVQMTGNSSRPGAELGDLENSPGLNPLNYLNPNDIESMQILKDASATAIYGSRGSNGVIIITTKKGRSGKPTVDVNTSVGFSNAVNSYDVLNADEYRDALAEYNLTSGDFGDDVDPMGEILRTGVVNNHSFAVNGGGEDGSYRISVGYLNQEGIVKENELTRLSANLGGQFILLENNRLGLDFNLLTSHTHEDGPSITTNAGFRGSLIGNALQWNPTHPLYNEDGTPVLVPGFGNWTNPVGLMQAYDDQSNTLDLIASISPSYKLTDDLTYRFTYSLTHGSGDRRAQLARDINIQDIENRGIAGVSSERNNNQILTHTLTWIKDLTPRLNLNAVGGFEYQKLDEKGTGFFGRDFIVDEFDYTNILQNTTTGSRNVFNVYHNPTTELQSYFLRTIFNWDDLFLLTATFRNDGSSKFGENNKYAFFPAFGVACNLHTLFSSDGPFDQLKLRVGWGQTGNSDFPAGSSQERWGFGQQSIALENVANPDLRWETTTTFNVGVDFAILDNKLFGTVEYFNKNTEDLLFQFPTIQPAPAGFYWINLDGNLINSGFELTLGLTAIESTNLKWDIGGNIAFLDNILEDYTGPEIFYGELFGQGISAAPSMRLANGQPLHAFYLRDHLEIGENGQSVYRDEEALFFLGDANSDIVLGITTNLAVGDFNFNVNFNGAMGHQIYNNTKNTVIPIGNLGSRNIDANLLEGDVQEATSNPIKSSDRYMEDGDYIKLSNASISYNIGKIGNTLKNTRIFITGQNLLVFTNYTGFDPEVSTINDFNGLPSAGIEYIPYPTARTVSVGANFTF